MMNVRVLAATALVAGLLLPAGVAAQVEVEPEVLFTVPADVPVNDLVPPPSPTYVTLFRGQPRIANDGTWYGLYSFPMSANPQPIEFTRDYVMLQNGTPWIREGLQLPGTPSFAPIADYAYSQQPFFDVSIAGDGTVAQVIRATDQFTLLGDGTPNPADLDYPAGQKDLVVLNRAMVAMEGHEVDVLPNYEYPRNAIESVSIVKAATANRVMVKADLDTGEGQFDPDTPVIVDLVNPGMPEAAYTLRFTTDDTMPLPDLGFNLSSLNANEEDVDYNVDGSILLGVDIEDEPYNLDGAVVFYNALTDTYELLAREGDPSPLPGRVYDSLFNKPVALNDNGDIAFLASVSGASSDDGIIVRNGEVAAQEDMTVGTAVPGPLQLGFANANIEMDDEGNIIWYGAWNELKENVCPDNPDITSPYVIFEGIFFNDQVLIEGGVTEVHDVNIDGTVYPTLVVKDLPNTGFAGFHVSPDGRWLIVHAYLAEPSEDICAFSINNDATPVAQVLLAVDLDAIGGGEAGDLDCDGDVDFDDINPFVLALSGQAGYEAAYPDCNWLNADCDEDGDVDFDDINPFVNLIGG